MTAIALLVALGTPIATPVPRQAGVCPNATGVTVVVDFQELGGGVNVVCAPGPVASGLEAMRVAGIAYQTAQRFPGFVCRIAGQPASDPCVNTSPASAYWAYWIAAPGGSWCYSTFGAGSRRPPPGTFEGWSFALDRTAAELPPPRFDPPAVPAGAAPITLNASDCASTPQPPASSPPTAAQTVPTTPAPSPPTPATRQPRRPPQPCPRQPRTRRSPRRRFQSRPQSRRASPPQPQPRPARPSRREPSTSARMVAVEDPRSASSRRRRWSSASARRPR